jgi:hypothetical protein
VFSAIYITVIPVILMLKGGRRYLNKVAPIRLYNLGRWGVVVNLLACFFVLESCVIYCFPYVQVSELVLQISSSR